MTRFSILFGLVPLTLALAFLSVSVVSQDPPIAEGIQIEPVVWHAREDYPSDVALYADTQVPVQTVYLKTHDVGDWMSRYDHSPTAVSGPDALRQRVREYNQLGIEVVAWFVPGRDHDVDAQADMDRQVELAKQVLDSGVKGLYADVEPFDGFCHNDCRFVAENFWLRLRSERPDAYLGTIYDPRPHHWETAAANVWLSASDAALPMCYWESFVDQPPWNDPRGCVRGAFNDLAVLSPGRPFEYIPMLQGDAPPERFLAAVEESRDMGLGRVSVWRRGIMPPANWDIVAPMLDPVSPLCARTLANGCLLRENSSPDIWVTYDGVRYLITSPDAFNYMAYNWFAVQAVPNGFLTTVPAIPPDGTILQDAASSTLYLVTGEAKVPVDESSLAGLGKSEDPVRIIPPGSARVIPWTPPDRSWLKELNSGQEWFIRAGARFPIHTPESRDALISAGEMSNQVTVVPQGSLENIPTALPDAINVREQNSEVHWRIVGGARLRRAIDPNEPPGAVVIIPDGTIGQLPAIPRDGTLIRQFDQPAVYHLIGGNRFPVSSPEALQALVESGRVNPTIFLIDSLGMDQIPTAGQFAREP